MSYLLTTLTKKGEVDSIIRDTIDKVLVLRFGRSSDPVCLQLDDVLSKSVREVAKFVTIAVVDIDSVDIQVYAKYFDITFIPSMVFFFNAHHMKMDSGYSFPLSSSVSFGLLCCIITLSFYLKTLFKKQQQSHSVVTLQSLLEN